MIFFIVARAEPLDFTSVTEPRATRFTGLVADQLQFVAWNEVYPSLEEFFAAIVAAARQDVVCREILLTLEQEFGLALLDPDFLAAGHNLQRTAGLFYETLYYWCDPRVGNPQTPTPAPVDPSRRVAVWRDMLVLGEATARAMLDYLVAQKGVPMLTEARRAQSRVFHNITDAARAILAEVSSAPVYRLDKLFALRLCRSDKLVKRQRVLLAAYRRRRGEDLRRKITATVKPLLWNESQYVKYYFGPALIKRVDASPDMVRAVLDALLDHALGLGVESRDDTVRACLAIWMQLPPAVQCAILFNDLRKFLELVTEQTYVRASLVHDPPFDEEEAAAYRPSWPASYAVVDPGGEPPVYPNAKVKFLRGWNPDEHAPYAIAYRVNLCPLWAGPSGHTVNALRHWVTSLGDDAPADTASVVAASLFLLWRLYYDKRISAAHTLTEAFEATFVAAAGPDAVHASFTVAPYPAPGAVLPTFDDAYDLLSACRVSSGDARGAVHPIGLLRTLRRCLWSSSSFAGYDALKRRIDEERAALTRQRLVVPQWAHDATAAFGVLTRSFAPVRDDDLRPMPVLVAQRALELLGPVLERIERTEPDGRGGPKTWSLHQQLVAELKRRDQTRLREQTVARRRTSLAIAVLGVRLLKLHGDGHCRRYLRKATRAELVRALRHILYCLRLLRTTRPLPGQVTVRVLPPEAVDYLVHALRSLRESLLPVYRAPTTPMTARRRFAVYYWLISTAWLHLSKHLPPSPPAPRKPGQLPIPMSPAAKAQLQRVIVLVQAMRVLFDNLTSDLRKGLPTVATEIRAAIRLLWKNLQEDAEFLRNATLPFRIQGTLARVTDEAIEIKVRQIARDLPGDLRSIRDGLRAAMRARSVTPTARGTLGGYASRVESLLPTATALREDLPGDETDLPDDRLVPPLIPDLPLPSTRPVSRPVTTPTTTTGTTSFSTSIPSTSWTKGDRARRDDQHWYSGGEIRVLLRFRLHDVIEDVYTMEGIDAHLHRGFTLEDNLREARVAIMGTTVTTVLVPVHVGGNHWTALSIHFDLTHQTPYLAPRIVYIDPQGTRSLPRTLQASLRAIFPGATCSPMSRVAYQAVDDGHNCGPWTVALLEHLARNDGQAPPGGTIDIRARRTADAVHMTGVRR